MRYHWQSIFNLSTFFLITCYSMQSVLGQILNQSGPLIRFSQNNAIRPKVQLRAEMSTITPSSSSPTHRTYLNSTTSVAHHMNSEIGLATTTGYSPSFNLMSSNDANWSNNRNRNFSSSRRLITSTMPPKNSHSLLSTTKPELETPQVNRFLTRDEWLAKEYFSYICAPDICMSGELREQVRQCFVKHSKLSQVISRCLVNSRCEKNTLVCVMEATRQDPLLIPLELHDCVDGLVNMRIWKCIRREQLSNPMFSLR